MAFDRPRYTLLMVVASLTFLLAGNLLAQNEFDQSRRLQRLAEGLKLTESQVEQVKLLYAEIDSILPFNRDEGSQDREAMREKMTKRRQLIDQKMGEILTEEQLELYQKLSRRSYEEEDLVKVLTKRLSLTDEQAIAIQGVIDDFEPSLEMLRKEMRQAGMDSEERGEIMERMRSLRLEIDRDIEKKLTEDQVDQYRDYKKERRSNRRRGSGWQGGGGGH